MRIKKFNESSNTSLYRGRLTVRNLIDLLSKFDEDLEVMILDGFNGGGNPRRINIGPVLDEIQPEDIDNTADCNIYNVGMNM